MSSSGPVGARRLTRPHAPARALHSAVAAWRRPAVRRTVQVGTVGAVLVATLAPFQAAQAAPERVLQSVAVEMGPDGSITSIDSRAIRKAGDAEATTDDQSFDPGKSAADLPVRVQTSYRLGGRSGTDLRDIEGEEGRVVIDVTVQNTTVRPQTVEYDTGSGTTARDYALVGAPMTVVGSAVLGEDDLSRVVITDDTAPDQVTNGVVSRGADGGSQVQWAAMLAPPRLAPTATFRLVQETASFTVPTFDFSVQPGLRTDTSVTRLLDSAFSDSDGGALGLQTSTISLIGNVNTALTDAGSVLNDIQSSLDTSAGNLGRRTVAELRTGRSRVENNLSKTVEQLDALDENIGDALESNSDDVTSTLSESIDSIRGQLGDPNANQNINLGFQGGCESVIPDRAAGGGKAPSDVLYQMRLVGAQLDALSTATGACADDLKQGLRDTVGQKDDVCTATTRTALCSLQTASTQLEAGKGVLAAFGTSLKNDLSDRDGSIRDLSLQIQQVTLGLAALQQQAAGLDGDSEDLNATAQLIAVATNVSALQSSVDQISLDTILDNFATIRGIAQAQKAAVGSGPTPGADSVLSRTANLANALAATCGFAPLNFEGDTADPSAPPIDFIPSSGHAACVGAQANASQLLKSLKPIYQAWESVETATDVTADVKVFTDNLSQVKRLLVDVTNGLDVAIAAQKADVSSISAQLNALYSAGLNPVPGTITSEYDPFSCDPAKRRPPPVEGEDPVDTTGLTPGAANRLIEAFIKVNCDSGELQGTIDDQIGQFADLLSGQQAQIAQRVRDTDAARAAAEGRVDNITGRLQGEVTEQSDAVVDKVTAGIREQRADLSTAQNKAVKGLNQLSAQATKQIGTRVNQSNRNLDATSTALQADLTSVLLDIGTRSDGGSGVLGTLSTSARRTGLSNDDLAQVGEEASAFRSVRGQQLADVRLQQEQTDESLQALQRYPSFGLDVPEGSSVQTVFTFHLGSPA